MVPGGYFHLEMRQIERNTLIFSNLPDELATGPLAGPEIRKNVVDISQALWFNLPAI